MLLNILFELLEFLISEFKFIRRFGNCGNVDVDI